MSRVRRRCTPRFHVILCVILAAAFIAALLGCGYTGSVSSAAVAFDGIVHGGRQPVSGSSIQLYAAGTTGAGSEAQPLLATAVESDSNGNFSIPAVYHCPSPSSQVYLVAQGGNPGLPSGEKNPALTLAAMLGSCSSLTSVRTVAINEVTTIGSVWPLASYMTSSIRLGSAASDASFLSAVASVPEFVNPAQGVSPGTPSSTSYFGENSKLYTLADVLADCAGTAGGLAGDGTPCGRLFARATPDGAAPPTDTFTAAMLIAQNPHHAVSGIYGLFGADTPFQPVLSAAPGDWTLTLSYDVATPALSPATGTYLGPQEVIISDATPASTIYYTTNGSVPTASSTRYTGAISIGISSTVKAVAVFAGSTSAVASSTLTINPVVIPAKLAFVQQPSNALVGSTISPAVTVEVEDAGGSPVVNATDPVTVALVGGSGLAGTLTVVPQNGIATFNNLSVSTAGTGLALSATSPNLTGAASAGFSIAAPGGGVGAPVKLVFQQQPSNALTGTAISPAVKVAVEDRNGNVVRDVTNPVKLTLTGGGSLGGTLTATPQNGIATFSNLTVSAAGSGLTLLATSPNFLSATSTSFTVTAPGSGAPSPAKLAFLQEPTNALTGAVISPAVQVAVQDAGGNTVTGATSLVTLALSGGGGLGGTLTVAPQNGIATFSRLTVSAAGSGLTLSASSPNLTPATSSSFSITAPAGGTPSPVKLAFLQQPTNALTGAVISPAVQVAVQDANGKTVSGAANVVTLALTGGGTLGGKLSAPAQNGIASFSNLTLGAAGNYTLSASSPSLTAATSAVFTISAPAVSSNGTTIMQSAPLSISAFPGGTFQVTYNWQAVPVAGQSSVFVDFIDSTGTVQFQDNVPPPVATSQWTGAVSYTHTVSVPSTVATGSYKIVAGIKSAIGNLSLAAGSGVSVFASGEYQVGTLNLASTCSITAHGAVGDGVTDNATAIQNTFNYAAANHCIALIPAGLFAYSGNITATGIAVAGTGAASILKPLSLSNESLTVQGTGGSVSNLVMVSAATTRLTTPWSGMIWVNNASNYYVENIHINNSSSTGILSDNSNGGYILNNTIENTLADSITQVLGSYNILVAGNRIMNSGDDGVSNNSYIGDPGVVHEITVKGNTVLNNKWGRGLEVSGGSTITFAGNYVDNRDGYTDMYIASESEWKTQSVDHVIVSGNTFVDGGPNQGSAIVYNSEAGASTITSVTIAGNEFVNPKMNAVQFAGAGSESGILVQDNTDYSTGAFSTSSNPNANATETGNQVLAPSTYTEPAVASGGGCSFLGC